MAQTLGNIGFVTIAVGERKYYELAYNLLVSYRLHMGHKIPFGIYVEEVNELVSDFDKVFVLDNPQKSYMDKIAIMMLPMFDHCVFIDADCLVYGDVSYFFEKLSYKGVTAFGHTLPLNSDKGWYNVESLGNLKNRINYGVSLHGGIYSYCNDELTKIIYSTSLEILAHYQDFEFKMFKKPADEPIIALSLALNNCHPVELCGDEFCFLPNAKVIRSNILKGYACYEDNRSNSYSVRLIHFQNNKTREPLYRLEVSRLRNGKTTFISLVDYYICCFKWALLRLKWNVSTWVFNRMIK